MQSVKPNPSLRRQLLRLDRVDRELRQRWVESGFEDRALARQLRVLVKAGRQWLVDVMKVHGWPGRRLVGAAAADAAFRLALHVEGDAAFQRRCLRLVRAAAQRGDVPLKQVAFLTDASRISAGQKQVFGTKFRTLRGRLVPLPLQNAARVDARRAELGLEPLTAYARRIARAYAT